MSHDTTATTHQTGHADAGAHAPTEEKSVFTQLMDDNLGDHHELNIFFQHLDILPVILVDNGLHVYANTHAMEDAGAYTMHHHGHGHHIVRAHAEHGLKETCPLGSASPALDLSVTNFVAYEWLAMIVCTILFMIARGRYRKDPLKAPKGIQNVLESVVTYVRDQIVVPNVGTKARAYRLMPYVLALFFFILTLNLIGLLPGGHAATGALGVTSALALSSFFVVNYIAIKDAGAGSWFKHLLGGAPVFLAPIMVPIEIVSLFTKPFALMIRLFANMTAGHIVLLSLVGLIFFFSKSMGQAVGWGVAPVSVAFSVFIYLLELLVAFLQAYIFAMLTSVFVGLALGDHAHDDHHAHAH
jgi:F-type H+-transporting ATPase subunit a